MGDKENKLYYDSLEELKIDVVIGTYVHNKKMLCRHL
jgi:hypothetical protein